MRNFKYMGLVCLFLLLGVMPSFSQNYKESMLELLSEVDQTHEQSKFYEQSNRFQRIAEVENEKWLPYYYAGFCLMNAAFLEKDKDNLDEICDRAVFYMDKASSLSNNNDEILCVRALLKSIRIKVNFLARGREYSEKSNEYLDKASSIDPKNPRAYYLKGLNIMNTPEHFGGGMEAAIPFFKKAWILFEKEQLVKDNHPLMPTWGYEHNAMIIKKYQSKKNS